MEVHPRVTLQQVAIVRLAVLKLHQYRMSLRRLDQGQRQHGADSCLLLCCLVANDLAACHTVPRCKRVTDQAAARCLIWCSRWPRASSVVPCGACNVCGLRFDPVCVRVEPATNKSAAQRGTGCVLVPLVGRWTHTSRRGIITGRQLGGDKHLGPLGQCTAVVLGSRQPAFGLWDAGNSQSVALVPASPSFWIELDKMVMQVRLGLPAALSSPPLLPQAGENSRRRRCCAE